MSLMQISSRGDMEDSVSHKPTNARPQIYADRLQQRHGTKLDLRASRKTGRRSVIIGKLTFGLPMATVMFNSAEP